ncbi:hypothetical protein BPS13_0112 [Bacillus phage BPS13]|uniref:Uncharacterized protein n=2 Tax=Wphvirus TaxID=1922327 RepID=W5QUA7_9CAUD|nr:hypothetical protein BPS13_0112 [Bacillus phage BPS13]YP_009002994.1 hypothetical protein BPS10C_108 [Bacillus phage BPS10C]AEZ50291.1 hypothetical protein BPS13_0112 [Bacillus phage BPS13]AGI12105.1 hypothetical protein BPS10C_108 [Bacillus phage BPS10C]
MAKEWTGWDEEEVIFADQESEKSKYEVKRVKKGDTVSLVLEPYYMSRTGWKMGTRKVVSLSVLAKLNKAVDSSSLE